MKQIYFLLLSFFVLTSLLAQRNDNNDFEGPDYFDTYHEYWNQQENWTIYNVHDPSIYKDGEWFYMYNTDVSMGGGTPFGAHKRRSMNLIDWEWLGTAFDGVPQSAVDFFLIHNPNYEDSGIWAPFLHKSGDEFRLYYSAPGGLVNQNLGFIGYATSSSAAGPWEDQGHVASSTPGDTINAIDPTVVIDEETGQHWMAYGSYQMGIYIVELDPETGGLFTPGDRGHVVARRAGGRHAAIEGPEIIYRNGWYYLFVSYDWLEDYYNVRVGRATSPEGPYYDINGNDMTIFSDNSPMILFPYKFNHHVGWQGTGHNSVFKDGEQYYIAHQGRPSTSIYNMVLHVRKIFWIDDWPVISPQRYADVPQIDITEDMIYGQWEHIPMIYNMSVTNLTPDIITLDSIGRINGNSQNTWALNADTLTMSWFNGQYIDKLIVSQAWDWENRVLTLVYTGMNQGGLNIWGKKINQEVIDMNTVLEHGSAYVIRNHHSNKVIDVAGNATGSNVRQWQDTGEETQEWVIIDTDDGYFMLYPMNTQNSEKRLVLEVANSSPNNGANIRIADIDYSDAQKWKIEYLNNGYFAMRSKISDEQRCIDVFAFSIDDGANLIQWEYLEGNNQFWRFERTRTNVDTGYGVGIFSPDMAESNSHGFKIFPNPVSGRNTSITLEVNGQQSGVIRKVYVRNMAGNVVYSSEFSHSNTYTFQNNLRPGVYFVSIQWNNIVINQKLVII